MKTGYIFTVSFTALLLTYEALATWVQRGWWTFSESTWSLIDNFPWTKWPIFVLFIFLAFHLAFKVGSGK